MLTTTPADRPVSSPTPVATPVVSGVDEALRQELLLLAADQNPRVALRRLEALIRQDRTVLRHCHAIAHEIGRAAYDRYGTFGEAMRYQSEVCNSGYMHGIIEQQFSRPAALVSVMRSLCEDYPQGKYMRWECHHGLGHGVMFYSANNLPRALKLCESLEDGAITCINGAFMENFNTDQKVHPSRYLRAEDPFYPCAEQEARYKSECYIYAPTYYLSLHPDEYAAALTWCETAEPGHQATCAVGVGSQAIKENMSDPPFVEAMCESGRADLAGSCIHGIAGLAINHFGALAPARDVCQQLKAPNRERCLGTVNGAAGFVPEYPESDAD